MVVPSIKLIVLDPVIITDQKMDTDGRINICRNRGPPLALDRLACVQLKANVKKLAQLSLSGPLVCWPYRYAHEAKYTAARNDSPATAANMERISAFGRSSGICIPFNEHDPDPGAVAPDGLACSGCRFARP
jgi:hypothetical protein